MSVANFFQDIGVDMKEVPPEQVTKLGLNNVLARPPFESLPKNIQDFVNNLGGLEPVEQLNLIHQYTRDLIKYEPAANEANDVPQNFAQTLHSPKGDCDDIAVFESGLVQYANERGVSHFNDVAIVGGDISYDFTDVQGKPQSADLSHNFVVVSDNSQTYYLDANAPHVGTADVNGGGFKSSLENSQGSSLDAHVFVKNIDVIQDVTNGTVSVSPETELVAEAKPSPQIAAPVTAPAQP